MRHCPDCHALATLLDIISATLLTKLLATLLDTILPTLLDTLLVTLFVKLTCNLKFHFQTFEKRLLLRHC